MTPSSPATTVGASGWPRGGAVPVTAVTVPSDCWPRTTRAVPVGSRITTPVGVVDTEAAGTAPAESAAVPAEAPAAVTVWLPGAMVVVPPEPVTVTLGVLPVSGLPVPAGTQVPVWELYTSGALLAAPPPTTLDRPAMVSEYTDGWVRLLIPPATAVGPVHAENCPPSLPTT